jgi:hypothetical protein
LWLASKIGAECEKGDIVRKRGLEIEGNLTEKTSRVSTLNASLAYECQKCV